MRRLFLVFYWISWTSLLWAQPAGFAREGDQQLPWDSFLDRCQEAQVLYLGEEHTGQLDHELQHAVVEGLARRGLKLAVVAEMFQWPQSQVLEDYVERRLDDEGLRTQSQWTQRWGYPWELYLPIWQTCQRYSLPLLPLRNSSESGKQLGTLGVEAWSADEREELAAEPYEFGPGAEQLRSLFAAHGGPVSEASFQRFLRVQVLWEEFMAAQIRKGLKATPDQVVVLVGKGHLSHGHGLPWRVQRGWAERLEQKVILVNPNGQEKPRASLEWLSPESPSTTD